MEGFALIGIAVLYSLYVKQAWSLYSKARVLNDKIRDNNEKKHVGDKKQ